MNLHPSHSTDPSWYLWPGVHTQSISSYLRQHQWSDWPDDQAAAAAAAHDHRYQQPLVHSHNHAEDQYYFPPNSSHHPQPNNHYFQYDFSNPSPGPTYIAPVPPAPATFHPAARYPQPRPPSPPLYQVPSQSAYQVPSQTVLEYSPDGRLLRLPVSLTDVDYSPNTPAEPSLSYSSPPPISRSISTLSPSSPPTLQQAPIRRSTTNSRSPATPDSGPSSPSTSSSSSQVPLSPPAEDRRPTRTTGKVKSAKVKISKAKTPKRTTPTTTTTTTSSRPSKSSQPGYKKPAMACMFCRHRKIACCAGVGEDRTCNQCSRRSLTCAYPAESRRGLRKGRPGKAIATVLARPPTLDSEQTPSNDQQQPSIPEEVDPSEHGSSPVPPTRSNVDYQRDRTSLRHSNPYPATGNPVIPDIRYSVNTIPQSTYPGYSHSPTINGFTPGAYQQPHFRGAGR